MTATAALLLLRCRSSSTATCMSAALRQLSFRQRQPQHQLLQLQKEAHHCCYKYHTNSQITCGSKKQFSSSASSSSSPSTTKIHPYKHLNQNNKIKVKTKDQGQSKSQRKSQSRSKTKHSSSKPSSSSSPLSRVLQRAVQNVDISSSRSTQKKKAPTKENAVNRLTAAAPAVPAASTTTTATSSLSATNLLSKCKIIMDKLIHKQSTLPPPPISWLLEPSIQIQTQIQQQQHQQQFPSNYNHNRTKMDKNDIQKRIEIYNDFTKLVHILTMDNTQSEITSMLLSSTKANVQSMHDLQYVLSNCLYICSNTLPFHYWYDYDHDENDDGDGENYDIDIEGIIRKLDSPMQNCIKIYNLLSKYNLDIQPIHYECIIKTANYNGINVNVNNKKNTTDETSTSDNTISINVNKEYYELGTKLFKKQINIDHSGYVPLDSRLGWNSCVEMGLFSVAMNALLMDNKNSTSGNESNNTDTDADVAYRVAKEVMDAVEEMCLVSPTDQERYILAAGSVLGRTGQYLGLPQYIHRNDNSSNISSKYGQTLIAAAMQACVECGQYELGLSLYRDLGDDPSSSEWQWAGGYGAIHPLCRDLALRCMGMIRRNVGDNDDNTRYSDTVTDMVKEIMEEGGPISNKAVISVFRAFESECDFERAIKLMHLILYHRDGGETDWKIVDDSAEHFLSDSASTSSASVVSNDGNESLSNSQDKSVAYRSAGGISDQMLLTLVMDACNASGEFGLAVLLCRLASMNNLAEMNNASFIFDGDDSGDELTPIQRLVQSQPLLSESDDILAGTMFALCGLSCPHDAISLHSNATKNTDTKIRDQCWDFSDECLEYANSLGDIQASSWKEAYRHIDRVIFAIDCIEKSKSRLTEEEEYLLSLAVAKMLRATSGCGQTRAGIYLAKIAAAAVSRTEQSSKKSIKQTVQSFFGLKETVQNDHLIYDDEKSLNSFLSSSDELLSATMEAYREIGDSDNALILFFSRWEGDSAMRKSVRSAPYHPDPDFPDREWIKSCDLALDTLLEQNRFDNAVAFYQAILPSYRSQHTYLIMARGYAVEEKWDDVSRLYSDALRSGCLSDDLALLALQGVAHGRINGKMRILRSIVDDIASLRQMKSGAWIFENYWVLKRMIGFHHARLLMWWNDPTTTQEQEFRVATQHLEKSNQGRGDLDPDALSCIIKLAGHKHRKMYGYTLDTEDAIHSQNEAANLIVNAVLKSFEIFEGVDHPSIISDGVSSLKSLGADRHCVDLVLASIDRGLQVNDDVLRIAKTVASSEGNDSALQAMETIS